MTEPVAEDTATQELPANHPPVQNMGGNMGNAMGMGAEDPPALEWKAPDAWKSSPNPNAMRLATYKVTDDTELVVSRAGGENVIEMVVAYSGRRAPRSEWLTFP